MNMSTKCENGDKASSPEDHIFKLTPIKASNKNKGVLVAQVDISEFLESFQDAQNCPTKNPEAKMLIAGSKEDEIINQIFGFEKEPQHQFVNSSSVDALQGRLQNDKLSSKQNSLLPLAESTPKRSVFDAAFPITRKCLICKESFQNYFQHVGTVIHKKRENTYISKQGKEVSLQVVIGDLIRILEKANSSKAHGAELTKRNRPTSGEDDAELGREPEKRKQRAELEPTCSGSLQSTGFLHSVSRKESFF